MLILVEALLGLIVFLCGACVFSFLNVVIYRVPNHISFVQGRSHCTTCGHMLHGYDMVPIVSWMFLRGKCRYCGDPVSARYSVVEAMGGVFALVCVWKYDFSFQALMLFILFSLLSVVSFVDMDTMEIPNGFVIALFVIGVGMVFAFPEVSLIQRLIGIVSVSVPLTVITLIIPGAFGGGDIKLMAAAGWAIGWQLNLLALFFGILFGGFYGIWLLAARKKGKKEHFAFGPFLCVGIAIAFLWGNPLLHWYLGFIL